MSYDQKCYDLAQFFLANAGITDTKTIELLAATIQGTIEDFIVDTGEVI
jgi:hypothetical protein